MTAPLKVAAICPNCGSNAATEFCPQCGQRQRSYRSSIWRIGWDLLVEVIDVDGRLWRTLRDLLLRPGQLPAAFSVDRRASYVGPLRLYLFSSLLFFFLLAVVPSTDLQRDAFSDDDDGVDVELQVPADSADPQVLHEYLDERDVRRLDNLLENVDNNFAQESIAAVASQIALAKDAGREPPLLLRRSVPGLVDLLDDPAAFLGKVIENLPLAMFVLLPFYALLLKLLFLNRGRYYAEHLVFALHLHVLAYLMFSVVIVLPERPSLVSDIAGLAAFLWLGIYTWLAMRNYYGGRTFAISLRFMGLGIAYLMLLGPALLVVMAFTFLAL